MPMMSRSDNASILGPQGRRYADDGRSVLNLSADQQRLARQVISKLKDGRYITENVTCPVCGAYPSDIVSHKDRYGIPMTVRVCCGCGMLFTSPRMEQASYAAFYNDEYRPLYGGDDRAYDRLYEKQCGRRGPRIAAFLEQSAISLQGKRVFEVGCRAGGILACLRDSHGCIVAGCDYGDEALNVGRERAGLDLFTGSLASVALPWRPDIIIYSHVMEHILDPMAECGVIKDRLAPGGIAYIEVPSVKNIRNAYRWDLLRYLQNAHTFHFSLATLNALMASGGFALVRGTDAVRAVYRATDKPTALQVNEYEDTVRYLRVTEAQRWLRYPLSFVFPPKQALISLLRITGLLDFVERKYFSARR